MNLNDSLGGMAKGTWDLFVFSERSWTQSTTEIDIERVNIRPRKFDCIGLINFDPSNMVMVKGKKKKNLL